MTKMSVGGIVEFLPRKAGRQKKMVKIKFVRKHSVLTILDLPKGAEWMIRGAYTPSFRIKQHPLEDAG